MLGLLVFGGCYTFRPATAESLPPGAAVRARLSPEGAAEVRSRTGEEADRVEGSLVRLSPDSLVLEVWRTDLRSEPVFEPGRMRLPLPKHHVVDLTEKRLSLPRTGAVTAALALGAYQVYRLLAEDAGGTRTGEPGGGGPTIIILCCP